ncbi:MAG: carbohydrate ABC transporter permease [Lachnospiraceae bacterium]|nr:carbohydrate ABC transporter permease [Candidatus Colinaster equi]
MKQHSRQMQKPKEDKLINSIINVALIIIGIIVVYPLWIVLISSISDPAEISSGKVWILPKGINIEAYKILLENGDLWIGYRNSLLYTIFGTALQMLITTPAAFALAKKTLPGRRWLILFFLFTMYFSGGLIPTYFVVKDLGLVNTPWALILPGLVGPYNLVIARTYYENSIPEDMYEAARIDGAGTYRCFVQIALPLSVPVLAVMILNFALGHWNSYMNALVYISDDNIQTLQVFIKRITTQATTALESGAGNIDITELTDSIRKTQLLKYAVVVVSSIPMIMLYPFIQKHFVKGIMLGSVKE